MWGTRIKSEGKYKKHWSLFSGIGLCRLGSRRQSCRPVPARMALALMLLLYVTAAPTFAAASIRSVAVWIGVEQFDDTQRPVLFAKARGSSYEVEAVNLEDSEQASGPAASRESQPSGSEDSKEEESGCTRTDRPPGSCEIELIADDGKTFAVMGQEDIRVGGVEGNCVKAVRKQAGTILVLTIELTGLKNIVGEIGRAELLPSGSGRWEKAANANMYQIQLYRDGERKGQSHRTKKTTFDFAPLMREGGVYSYQVTPISLRGKKGKPQESARIRLDGEQLARNRAARPEGRAGWSREMDGLHYWYQDGLYPQNTWLELEGGRYYFDNSGIMIENGVENQENEENGQ